MTQKKLSRREAGALMMGSAGALAATSAVAAGGTGKSIASSRLPTDPREIMEALVRIYGTTGPKRVTWKTRITVYAVQPSGVTPLIGLRGSESSWWTRKDESTWVRYSSTLSFFEDLQTRQFIEEYRNPLNVTSASWG